MILTNGNVLCDDFVFRKYDIKIEDGRIVELDKNLIDSEMIDCCNNLILPGFIDTHMHGAAGTRVGTDTEALYEITRFEATQGVTSVALATEVSLLDEILMQIETIVKASKRIEGTKIVAINAEGPFLNENKKGAMKAEHILLPDREKFNEMMKKSEGLLKIMTVAPELNGVIEFIQYAVSKGVTISLGHTDAEFDISQKAFDAGATHTTHTFNAMRALNHREPGVLGAALINKNVTCEMICDFVHLHPVIVELIYRTKGADNVNIISDSGNAAGIGISEFEVDGVKRYVKDGVVRLEDGTIAGSACSIFNGIKNLIKLGIPIEEISKMASYNPAKTLKLENEIGSIAVGKYADLVVLDNTYNIIYTFVNGKCVYKCMEI